MKLTPAERLLLVNQCRILSALTPSDAVRYNVIEEVLRQGYEGLYPLIARELREPPMSVAECRQVIETLEMFRVLQMSYRRLDDRTGIDQRGLRFMGFDPDDEPRQHELADFLLRVDDRFAELRSQASAGDRLPGRVETYRPMLSRFRWHWDPRTPDECLTREGLLEVLGGAAAPSQSAGDWHHHTAAASEEEAPRPG